MLERHPRSAIGWNGQYYFLVEVDGRKPDLSVGMTLAELAAYLAKLGCEEAMNLDGGGSATLWFAGAVRNRPCDGYERGHRQCPARGGEAAVGRRAGGDGFRRQQLAQVRHLWRGMA
jgi:hypothetical protein